MAGNFPYAAAAFVTAAVGAVTSGVWGAQVQPHVPPRVPVPAMRAFPVHPAMGQAGPMRPPVTLAPNLANTPGFSPGVPTQPSTGYFAPANVGQIVGVPGNPGGAQAPGLTQASQFAQPSMNQPGQPPFGEMLYSMQTYMNQPGVQDFYTLYNPTVVQANEGITPSIAYPNATTPQTGVPAAVGAAVGRALTQGPGFGTVGFYNGFGPGQADWGFYNGFTAPR
jgi:hypothetical protein